MRNNKFALVVFFVVMVVFIFCYTSNIKADIWLEEDYYPEPILFVHGINSNAQIAWGNLKNLNGAVPELSSKYFDNRYYPRMVHFGDPLQDDGPQQNYVQSFDYGGATYVDSFQAVSYNSWDKTQGLTLKQAIEDVSRGYRKGDEYKDVMLVCHGMGGLLARYYLRNKYIEDPNGKTYVRRLVTLGTPHKGTAVANYLRESSASGGALTDLSEYAKGVYDLFNKIKFSDWADYIKGEEVFKIQYRLKGKFYLTGIGLALEAVKHLIKTELRNATDFTKFMGNWQVQAESLGLQNISLHLDRNWAFRLMGDFYLDPTDARDPLFWNVNVFLEGPQGINYEEYPRDVEYVHTIFEKTDALSSTSGRTSLSVFYPAFPDYMAPLGNSLVSTQYGLLGTIASFWSAYKEYAWGDGFVSAHSQKGEGVYNAIMPVLSYNQGYTSYKANGTWQEGPTISNGKDYWKGNHFREQTHNIEAILQGIDGIKTHGYRFNQTNENKFHNDIVDFSRTRIQYYTNESGVDPGNLSIGEEDLLEVTKVTKKQNVPVIDISNKDIKFKISFLMGIKGNKSGLYFDPDKIINIETGEKGKKYYNKGQEYLPRSMTLEVTHLIKDTFVSDKAELIADNGNVIRQNNNSYIGFNKELSLNNPKYLECNYNGEINKFADYQTYTYLNFIKQDMTDKYIYLFMRVKNAAGVVSEEKVFVFKVVDYAGQFEIDCSFRISRNPGYIYSGVNNLGSATVNIRETTGNPIEGIFKFYKKEPSDTEYVLCETRGLSWKNQPGERKSFNLPLAISIDCKYLMKFGDYEQVFEPKAYQIWVDSLSRNQQLYRSGKWEESISAAIVSSNTTSIFTNEDLADETLGYHALKDEAGLWLQKDTYLDDKDTALTEDDEFVDIYRTGRGRSYISFETTNVVPNNFKVKKVRLLLMTFLWTNRADGLVIGGSRHLYAKDIIYDFELYSGSFNSSLDYIDPSAWYSCNNFVMRVSGRKLTREGWIFYKQIKPGFLNNSGKTQFMMTTADESSDSVPPEDKWTHFNGGELSGRIAIEIVKK